MKKRKLLMLLALLGVIAAFSGILQAETNPLSDVFSVNFYRYGPLTGADQLNITLEENEAAGLGEWNTTGWFNAECPWSADGTDETPDTITSTGGNTASFYLHDTRNGGPYDGVRPDLIGDGNGDLMDGHGNGTLEDPANPDLIFHIELTDISFDTYDVILYVGSQAAQYGQGRGKYVVNDGPEQDFYLTPGRFDGTFTEIVDGANPGNYILLKGMTGSTFDFKIWGNGAHHIGLCGLQLGVLDVMDPSPANGDIVLATNPLTLSWTNLAPVDSADSTYVDVWFGTEPNELNPAYDMTKIVDAGVDVTSTTVDASVEGTYYWQVNSYLDGDPATTIYNNEDPNDPNVLAGHSWIFTASNDTAPTVEMITLDQVTWSGGPVPLVADITNAGESATIIEWVADPADNVVIEDGDTATPTVTITKTPSFTAKIPSAGFEDPVVPDNTYGTEIPTGWTITGYAGIADAAPGGIIDIVDEGEQCVWANPDASFSTVLRETVQSGATYTLSVAIGHGQWSSGVKYLVQLIALDGENELVLAEDDNSNPPAALQTWSNSIVSYTNDPVADANKVDLPLMIKLVNPADSPGGADVEFDNVVLTSDTLFPVQSGVDTVTLTVFVSDAANPTPVQASVEIDVYDDACTMARAFEGKDDLSDLNKDCSVDVDDLALMAVTWLNTDNELDDSVVNSSNITPPDTFSINFYMYPWPWTTSEQFETITLEPGQSAGVDTWQTDRWSNYNVPWAPTAPQSPVTLTSSVGSEATFNFNNCRNGGAFLWDAPRTTLPGDGNADLMDGHINSTLEDPLNPDKIFDMEMKDIPFDRYDVIFYMGGNEAQFYDGKGIIVFNGVEHAFTLIKGFDGTFTEIKDETTPGNYIVFEGLSDSNFSVQTWSTSQNGFAHLGPCGFQVRQVNDPNGPGVSAGDNWITWQGQPVSLTGTVDGTGSNWDMGDLAYSWTTYPDGLNTNLDGTDDHLDVEILNPDSETPTITVAQVSGPDPFLLDSGFEHNAMSDGSWNTTPGPYWIDGQYVLTDPANPVWEIVSSGAGVRNPNTSDWVSGTSYEGENYMMANSYVGEDSGLFQILSSTLEANTSYEITLMVGNYDFNVTEDNPTGAAGDYRVELVAGGVVVASVSGPSPASGTWAPASLSYNSGSSPAQLGEQLEIRILAEAYGGDTGEIDGIDVCFDDVTFTIDGESTHITPPSKIEDMISVSLKLTVEEVSTGKTANGYTTIDVYDNACNAGVASNPETDFDLGDLNQDCNTNLDDVAELAAAWFVDYSSTVPIDQPEE